ncbi:MAG: acetate--CoA ligase [Bdellovibrionales bacterium]|nr:acetate--CoA ligase [Bdellovibrionales bacterium]
MDHPSVFPVPEKWQKTAYITKDKYKEMVEEAHVHPDRFWSEQAHQLEWKKPWEKVSEVSFNKPVTIKWFLGGKINISENCLDRHLENNGEKVAFYWEPESLNESSKVFTYNDVHQNVCKLANVLKSNGVKKGDRVTIYLPMIPEAVFSLLACARIGAVHSVVFAGFSPNALADRIHDGQSDFIITADEGYRAGRTIALKANVDEAVKIAPLIRKTLVVQRTGANISWNSDRDLWYHEEMQRADTTCSAEEMDSEDPLFILYTSGSTSKPKGILHTTGGYLTYAAYTFKNVFNYHSEQVYWCAADIGWITGHSYIVYGPMANGATSVLFEGAPTYPTPARIWEIVDKYKIDILYTAPTLIRSLISAGNEAVSHSDRKSLDLLGSVGEPINVEAWLWYHDVIGKGECPIVDTWWQTETGGILISPLPGATDLKPGSASFPLPGIKPVLVDEKGKEISGEGAGQLCISNSWPGQMRGIYGDPERFYTTYFSQYPGKYFTGDGCRRDKDGYYWITGRVDDVLNVSGHRLGTAEIESSIDSHDAVAEAAIVGFPHEIKGQGIYAFVTLKEGREGDEQMRKELIQAVRKEISPIAQPDFIQWAPALPKTRSGKIMRRILRKIAADDYQQLGDTSTLADPAVVTHLIENRMNRK